MDMKTVAEKKRTIWYITRFSCLGKKNENGGEKRQMSGFKLTTGVLSCCAGG